MKMLPRQTLTLFTALTLGAVLVTGCSESPQEKYSKATSHLNDVKEDFKQAKKKVTDQQGDVSDAQSKLHDLQDKVNAQRKKVVTATQAVDKTVSDQVLFRTLQKELLNKDEFSDAAISVAVSNLTVTLTGSVPDQDTHDQAIKTTRNQPGVADINDQLKIADQQSGKDNKQGQNEGQGQNGHDNQDQGQNQDQDKSPSQDKKNGQKQGNSPSPAENGTGADSSGDTPPTDLPAPPGQEQGPESSNGGDSAIPQNAPPAQSSDAN